MKIKALKITKFALVGIFLLGAVSINAQEFNKGDNDLNVGLGFGNPWILGGYTSKFPTISVSFDHGLRDDWGPGVFGVGGYVATGFYKYDASIWGTSWGVNYFSFILGARASYHYSFVEKLDTYGGAILGLNITTASEYGGYGGSTDAGVSAVHDLYVGAKYYFSDTFAAYSELATYSTLPVFTLGACFKF